MSLQAAIDEIVVQMTEEMEELKKDGQTTTARIFKGYIGQLKTLSKMAADSGPRLPGGARIPTHREMIEQAKTEMRAAKDRGDGQEEMEPRQVMCVGGPANGAYYAVPQEIPEGADRFCFVLGDRYRLSDDNQQLEYAPDKVTKKGKSGKGGLILG